MPPAYFAAAAALLAADVLLRPWASWKKRGGHHAAYLLVPYAPLFIGPLMPEKWMALVYGLVALGALFSFSNMVGLTAYPRFFFPAAVVSAAFFGVAQMHWYGLFQAMPVFGLAAILAVATPFTEPRGFLQKLCLAWLGSLIYGYLWGHAAMFLDTDFHGLGNGKSWDLLALLCAKAGDTAWVAARDRLRARFAWVQLLTTVIGAVAGGALAAALFPPGGAAPWQLLTFGAVVGLGLTVGSCGHDLITRDVLEKKPEVPLKQTMLFGFSFSLALGYHLIRYYS
ncbi:MAG TPA: hypothetical protein VND93_24340 [Myxococcales bacterium]|nr:hypothetical protein [Myxococcales bacterium]